MEMWAYTHYDLAVVGIIAKRQRVGVVR